MELGLYAASDKCIVCCPKDFWREGNIDILCQRYNIPLFTNYEEWIEQVKEDLNEYKPIIPESITYGDHIIDPELHV
jgi:hypothetical protein